MFDCRIAQRKQLAFSESLILSGVILMQTEGGHCHSDKYSNMTEGQPSKRLLLVPIFMEQNHYGVALQK